MFSNYICRKIFDLIDAIRNASFLKLSANISVLLFLLHKTIQIVHFGAYDFFKKKSKLGILFEFLDLSRAKRNPTSHLTFLRT